MNDYDYDDDDGPAFLDARPVVATWIVTGDSYHVKDKLRAVGCKWQSYGKYWMATGDVMIAAAKEIMAGQTAAKQAAQVAKCQATGNVSDLPVNGITGQHVGTVGDKITVTVTLESAREIETEFNRKKVISTCAIFVDAEGRKFKWFTASFPAVEFGSTCELTGTIKTHEVYKDERQTALTRCKIAGVAKLVPTHSLTIFCDAKSSADHFAFTDASGAVLEHGSLGLGCPENGDNSDHELAAAMRAFDFAGRVRDAAGLDCLALDFRFDAKWMQGMVGKGRPLRDAAKANKLIVEMNWISGSENPADEFTTASGSHTTEPSASMAVKLEVA